MIFFAVSGSLAFAQGFVDSSAVHKQISEVQNAIEQKGAGWTAGITSISFLTEEQKKGLCGLRITPEDIEQWGKGPKLRIPEGVKFPPNFDWRYGGVTPVQNQGNCGSCWAFSVAAAFESQLLIYYGMLVNLSEQQILSCNDDLSNNSCNGGYMTTAYRLFQNYGAVSEQCMPYDTTDRVACIQSFCPIIAKIGGYVSVNDDVSSIKYALQTSPIAVGMKVYSDFMDYTGGCYEYVWGNYEGLHAVTIVGWDDNMCGGAGAWIVKNSWGNNWGDNGYFYIKYNNCDIGMLGGLITPTGSVVTVKNVYLNGGGYDVVVDNYAHPSPYTTAWVFGAAHIIGAYDYFHSGNYDYYFQYWKEVETNTYHNGPVWTDVLPTLSQHTFIAYFKGGPYEVQITSPTAGISWEVGQYVDITWNAPAGLENTTKIDIALSRDGGASFEHIVNNLPHSSGGTGKYTWQATGLGSTSCIISVTAHDAVNNTKTTRSGVFRIVDNRPRIVLNATMFNFAGIAGGNNPPNQILNITNGGGSTLNWSAGHTQSWLTPTPASGTAPSSVTLSVNLNSLSFGIYSDTIIINASGASNSPQKAAVRLTVNLPGDVNGDGQVTLSDVVYLINYLFKFGPEPANTNAADPNGDCKVSLSDVVRLINYLFKSGPAPLPGCVK